MNKDAVFAELKKVFKRVDEVFLKSHRFLYRDTEKGIWGAADLDAVYLFFHRIGLDKYKSFLDIGCGDGRVVFVASLFTKAVGVEFDAELIKVANQIKEKFQLPVRFYQQDVYDVDFSKFEILFINPDTNFFRGLEEKLLKEMTGKLYVYNKIFLPEKLKRGKTHWVNQVPITEFSK